MTRLAPLNLSLARSFNAAHRISVYINNYVTREGKKIKTPHRRHQQRSKSQLLMLFIILFTISADATTIFYFTTAQYR